LVAATDSLDNIIETRCSSAIKQDAEPIQGIQLFVENSINSSPSDPLTRGAIVARMSAVRLSPPRGEDEGEG
jgi:hypothetical protein